MSALRGRRIVVTRAAAQADALAAPLRAAGAEPVLVPTIAIAPPDPCTALDAALRSLADHEWVVFTSVNGVQAALARANALGLRAEAWRHVRIAAVGPATASALGTHGLYAIGMPAEHRSERVVDVMGDVQGARVLLLRGELARPALPRLLEARGARTTDVIAYRTLAAPPDPGAAVRIAGADAITFTSTSTAHGLAGVLGDGWRVTLEGVAVASIGPVTSRALEEMGLPVAVEATQYTVPGLIAALERFFGRDRSAAQIGPDVRSGA